MMLGEKQALGYSVDIGDFRELVGEQLLLEKLLLQPERNCHAEGAETTRRESQIGFEQPFEFQERLVIKRDLIDVFEIDAGRLEAVADRALGKAAVVALARKPFLLCSGDDF